MPLEEDKGPVMTEPLGPEDGDPTPEEIAAITAEIREQWTETQRRSRAMFNYEYSPPVEEQDDE